MNAILFVLRTGCQWNVLNAIGICSSSSAHRHFLEWTEYGVFEQAWVRALHVYDQFVGIDWGWLSMDGAMSKAPLGGKKTGPNPTDRAKGGSKRSLLTEANGIRLASPSRARTSTTSSFSVKPSRAFPSRTKADAPGVPESIPCDLSDFSRSQVGA
jgi:transposase